MYQALYRKWRPQTFSDVYGQPHITKTLQNEVSMNRLSHAYLFTGSRGTGKTTCAKILAKAVNCTEPGNGNPCNRCEACKGIGNGSVLDVLEIDAASNNGVDSIRDLREEANFTPVFTKYRVYIIDEVHMLSIGAFNALLKTLEEPPPHVIFILATTEVHKLPATIMSRCQRFDFRHIPSEDIAARLAYVAQQESFLLEPEAALLIARLSDGALRDALSLLDQCSARDKNITLPLVEDVAGLTGKDYLFEISTAIRNRNAAENILLLDKLHNNSCDMKRLCGELIEHFRHYMLVKTLRNPGDLIICSPKELERIRAHAGQFSLESILYTLDLFQETLESLHRGANHRIEMEMALVKLSSPNPDGTTAALLSRMAALEARMQSGAMIDLPAAKPELAENTESVEPELSQLEQEEEPPTAQIPSPPIPEKPPVPEEAPESLPREDRLLDKWAEIIETLKKIDIAVMSILIGSSAHIRGDFILIDSQNPLLKDFLSKKGYVNSIKEAVRRVLGQEYKLGVYKKTVAPATPKQDPLDALIDRAEKAGIRVNLK